MKTFIGNWLIKLGTALTKGTKKPRVGYIQHKVAYSRGLVHHENPLKECQIMLTVQEVKPVGNYTQVKILKASPNLGFDIWFIRSRLSDMYPTEDIVWEDETN